MIQSLRHYSESWLFKAFLAVVVFCFVFIGVADLIRSFIYDRPIAIVGEHSISQEEFDRFLRNDIRRIQMATKSQISLQDLNEFGFVEKVLDRLIAQHLLEQEMKRLKVVVSENTIRNNAQSMEPFIRDGRFDPTQFKAVLRNAGITEQILVQDMRKQLIQQQYFLTFAQASVLPAYYRDVLLTAMLQKRAFSTVFIPTQKMIVDQKDLSVEALKQFYEAHKEDYKTSEKRDITVLYFDLKKMTENIQVSEEELKAAYNNKSDIYVDPEKRDVYKISFPTQADFEQLKTSFANDFSALEKSNPNLKIEKKGIISKGILSPEDDEIVFSLNAGELSEQVQHDMGYAVYVVKSIIPQKQKTFEEIKASLLLEMRIERFSEDYRKMRNAIEDELAGGAKINEILSSYPALKSIPLVGLQGDNVENLPDHLQTAKTEILQQAFDLTEGSSSNFLNIDPYSGVIIFVDKIHPENIPAYDEVKNAVQKDFMDNKQAEKARALAQKISSESKNIGSLAKLASQNGVTLETNQVYSRITAVDSKKLQDMNAVNIVDRAFALPLNQTIFAPVKNGFLVIMAEKNIKDDFDQAKKEEVLKKFEQLMYDSVAMLLTENLRKNYKVVIKQENLDNYLKSIMRDA